MNKTRNAYCLHLSRSQGWDKELKHAQKPRRASRRDLNEIAHPMGNWVRGRFLSSQLKQVRQII